MAAVAALALATAGCGVRLDAKETRSTRTFTHTGDQLTINSALGGLRVLPGAAGGVRVDRWLRGKAAADGNASWSLENGTLKLGANCTVVFGDCGARYHVRVPPGVRLVIRSADEGVILRDLAQDLDVSSTGPIRAYGTSGALRLRGQDDLIAGDRLRSADVRARTAAGPIHLSFAAPPSTVELLSGDGRVTARLPAGPYRVTATSTHGRARSQIKSTGGDRTIVARSTTGDVRVEKS